MRFFWVIASFLLAALLLVLLFNLLKAQPQDVLEAVFSVPVTVMIVVTALTIANQFIAAIKWRISLRELSPDASVIGLADMSEATAWGAFFGQFLPPQISTSFARWLYSRSSHRAGAVVGSTLFEQLFDFVVLSAAAVSGGAILVFGFQGASAAIYFLLASVGALAALRISLAVIESTLRNRATVRMTAVANAIARARSISPWVLFQLTGLSVVRLVLVGSRACLIVLSALPGIDLLTVALGFPVTGLAMAVPIVPAGIGAAEWTWAGLLVLAGAAAAPAAAISVAVRLINLGALGLVLIGFWMYRRLAN